MVAQVGGAAGQQHLQAMPSRCTSGTSTDAAAAARPAKRAPSPRDLGLPGRRCREALAQQWRRSRSDSSGGRCPS
jgi:hypothetical protein